MNDTDIETTIGLTLRVNARAHDVEVTYDETLLRTLRDRLGFYSVRQACGIGVCGTCTVLLDGQAVSSCILLSVAVGEREVTTSEGLGTDTELGRVSQAFLESDAYQCSYCIPGMIVAMEGCLRNSPHASEEEVVEELAGNLCRCGCYPQIRDAVSKLVAVQPKSEGDDL